MHLNELRALGVGWVGLAARMAVLTQDAPMFSKCVEVGTVDAGWSCAALLRAPTLAWLESIALCHEGWRSAQLKPTVFLIALVDHMDAGYVKSLCALDLRSPNWPSADARRQGALDWLVRLNPAPSQPALLWRAALRQDRPDHVLHGFPSADAYAQDVSALQEVLRRVTSLQGLSKADVLALASRTATTKRMNCWTFLQWIAGFPRTAISTDGWATPSHDANKSAWGVDGPNGHSPPQIALKDLAAHGAGDLIPPGAILTFEAFASGWTMGHWAIYQGADKVIGFNDPSIEGGREAGSCAGVEVFGWADYLSAARTARTVTDTSATTPNAQIYERVYPIVRAPDRWLPDPRGPSPI